ncbi:MAG: DUF2207 domain-containing protein [Trueperaceae bacterium]
MPHRTTSHRTTSHRTAAHRTAAHRTAARRNDARASTGSDRPAARLAKIVVLLAVATLACTALARFEWRDVRQQVDIRPDGTVDIEDERTLWTNDDFGEAFLCIEHGPDVTVTLLDGTGPTSPGPDARARTAACESGAAGTELIIDQTQRVSERRVRFHYRLDGTVDVHDDVAQWYWNPYGRNNPVALGYHLTVTTPAPAE